MVRTIAHVFCLHYVISNAGPVIDTADLFLSTGISNFLNNFHPNLKFSHEKSDLSVSIVSLEVSVSLIDKKT